MLGALGLAILASASACSGSGSKKHPAAPSTGPGATESSHSGNSSAAAAIANVPSQPVASVPSSVLGVQFEVYLLKRTGSRLVALVGALNNTGTAKFNLATELGEDRIAGYNVSALSLVDSVSLKQYLTFRTTEDSALTNGCVCSSTIDAFRNGIQPGARWFFSALFPAPPPDVTGSGG
jgi:hypothetical protein